MKSLRGRAAPQAADDALLSQFDWRAKERTDKILLSAYSLADVTGTLFEIIISGKGAIEYAMSPIDGLESSL
jgi:hypothetical protein